MQMKSQFVKIGCIRACVIFIVFCLGVTMAMTMAHAQTSPKNERHAKLLNKLQQKGQVDIIVMFSEIQKKQKSNAAIGSPLSVKNLVATKQAQILQLMPANSRRLAKTFRYTPQMALSADYRTLQMLLADSSVTVFEDKLNKPFLADTVPLIFPDYATSVYTGNNEWVVAVLDSGVDLGHPFLAYNGQSKVVAEACYSNGNGQSTFTSSLCPNGVFSSTAAGSGQACPDDVVGCDHGTHVAGIAVGHDAVLKGVAQMANLISMQIFSQVNDEDFCFPDSACLGAYDSDVIAALERVYELRNTYKIAAVNLSLGIGAYTGSCDDQPHQPIIVQLRQAGIATIVASGNAGLSSQIAAPACITEAIAVGATDGLVDNRANYSNNGSMVDLYAPGTGIDSSVPVSAYATKTGTSMAAPHVAGAWVAAKQAYPDASVDLIEQTFKEFGPDITSFGIVRKRVYVTPVVEKLLTLNPDNVADDCDFFLIGDKVVVCL